MSGAGAPPGSPLQVELFSDPVLLGTTTADASGAFRVTVTVPLDTSPGLHTLRVSAVGGTFREETTLVVSAPAVVQSRTQQVLSRTGGAFTRATGAAAAIGLAGFVLVALAWQGGHRQPAFGRRSQWPRRRR